MRKLAFTVAALSIAGALQAHDFWIEPSTFHPSPGETVSIGLRVGQDFTGDPVPRDASAIERFVVRQGRREEEVTGVDRIDPAGFVRADGVAPAIVAYQTRGSTTELAAAKFEEYLRKYGLERIIDARTRRGERHRAGRERFVRCAKALLAGARASLAVTQPVGLRYEIVPSSVSTAFRARVLFERTPVEGARVVAIFRDDPSIRLVTHSDDAGAFAVALPRAGIWLIESVHMTRADDTDADWESFWASLTFDAALTGRAATPPPHLSGSR